MRRLRTGLILALVAPTLHAFAPESASAQAVSTYATGITSARAVAFDAAGNLYATGLAAGTGVVRQIPAGGGAPTLFAVGFANPVGMAFSASGDLYVADIGAYEGAPRGRIWKVSAGGIKSTFASGFLGPAFLAFDASGDLLVSERPGRRLRRISPSGVVSDFGPPLGGTGEFVGQFVIEPSGDVMVAVTGSLKRMGSAGTSVTTFCIGLGDAYGLARGPQGEWLVGRFGSSDLLQVSLAGVASPYAGSTEGCDDGLLSAAKFGAPLGLAVRDSRLFIADRDCEAVRMIEHPTPSAGHSWGSLKATYR